MKKDGTFDKRTKEGKQSIGKTLAPKTIKRKIEKGLKNTEKSGKKI
jgi:hypothetical protein